MCVESIVWILKLILLHVGDCYVLRFLERLVFFFVRGFLFLFIIWSWSFVDFFLLFFDILVDLCPFPVVVLRVWLVFVNFVVFATEVDLLIDWSSR